MTRPDPGTTAKTPLKIGNFSLRKKDGSLARMADI